MKLRFKYGHTYPYYKPFNPKNLSNDVKIRFLPGGENLHYQSMMVMNFAVRVERMPINFIISKTGAEFA